MKNFLVAFIKQLFYNKSFDQCDGLKVINLLQVCFLLLQAFFSRNLHFISLFFVYYIQIDLVHYFR